MTNVTMTGFARTTVLALGLACAPATLAFAQDYPARSVEVIHQFGPGGGTDRFIRAIAEPLQALTNQTFVPISITGGGGIPAVVTYMQRPSDGYTILSLGPEEVINHALGRIDLSTVRPIARIQYDQGLFLVRKDSPLQTVDDLIAQAKETPGSIKVAVTGTAGFDDALVGLWNQKSGAEVITVPFNAAEMVSNTLGGHVDMMYEEYGAAKGLIESGDLRPLVLFSDARLPELPDVPTAAEKGIDVTLGRWRGFGIKADTDSAVVDRLAQLMAEAAASESYKTIEAESALQYRSEFFGPAAFQTFLEAEIGVYTDVMKQLGYIN